MNEPFTLGQAVFVKARALALYSDQVQPGDQITHRVPAYPNRRSDVRKHLYRREIDPHPIPGVIVGWRRRATGWYDDNHGNWRAYYPDDPSGPYLHADKYHKLWMVAWSLRWRDPIEALAEDIEPLAREEGT